MRYYFPTLDIFYSAIPKTGCTTLLWELTKLELELEKQKFKLKNNPNSFHDFEAKPFNFVRGTNIHLPSSLKNKFKVESNFQNFYNPIAKIITLRNPVTRFTSFWFDKVVFNRDITYSELSKKLISISDLNSVTKMRARAKEFLYNLDFRESHLFDPHYRPQYQFEPNFDYFNLKVSTELISDIPKLLSTYSTKYQFLLNYRFANANQGFLHSYDEFYDLELIELINNLYEKDFSLFNFENVKLNNLKDSYLKFNLQNIISWARQNSSDDLLKLSLEIDALKTSQLTSLNRRTWPMFSTRYKIVSRLRKFKKYRFKFGPFRH